MHNTRAACEIFHAIERRDFERLLGLCTPDVAFVWPPSLPYGNGERGAWAETWIPLQPAEPHRRMDPRIVAASDDEVVVLWRQRGVAPEGESFDGEVLGLYRFREGKLARAQMFYFDTVAVAAFLNRAAGRWTSAAR